MCFMYHCSAVGIVLVFIPACYLLNLMARLNIKLLRLNAIVLIPIDLTGGCAELN